MPVAGGLGFVVILAVAAGLWWRNHDILSDLYDYSSVIAAAGKIEAGLKPYVDFRSTMQSATYLLNHGSETLFGRNYQGLTVGGLVFLLLGAAALFRMWSRACGLFCGLALTAAVTWSGLSQHVVIFYNPIGILCLALVVAGVAHDPKLWGAPTLERCVVFAAVLLSGLNKINFHLLGLALAAVLVVEAWMAGRLPKRDAGRSLVLLGVVGLVLPVVAECLWTGASPRLWYDNVIGLAQERLEYCARLTDPTVYFGPAHDLHRHIPLKQLTAPGLALLLAVGAWAAWVRWQADAPMGRKVARLGVILVYVGGAAVGGVLLTITNVEIITLTSLAFLIAAAGLWVSVQAKAEEASVRNVASWSWLVILAGAFWAVNGGLAAWRGSRVLFAREESDRSVFVRLENAPMALRYLEGVRLDANLHATLLLAARELEKTDGSTAGGEGILFGPTFEWMERAYPQAIMRGMPVWYHLGTSLTTEDTGWLIRQLETNHVHRILAHPDWESWPADFRQYLEKSYRPIPLGAVGVLREMLGAEKAAAAGGSFQSGEPLALIERTGSNLHLLGSPPPQGFDFSSSPWGDYLGGGGAWQWDWTRGLSIVEGLMVVGRNDPRDAVDTVKIRASTRESDASTQTLWETSIRIEPGQQWARVPFRITPYGKPVRMSVENTSGQAADFRVGCRELQIKQTTDSDEEPPPPTTVAGAMVRMGPTGGKMMWLRSAAENQSEALAWQTAPVEVWSRVDEPSGAWRVTLETGLASSVQPGTLPVAMLLWYRAGRVELLSQRAIESGPLNEITLEAWMPEPGGWIGVAFRPMERGKPFNLPVRVRALNY